MFDVYSCAACPGGCDGGGGGNTGIPGTGTPGGGGGVEVDISGPIGLAIVSVYVCERNTHHL